MKVSVIIPCYNVSRFVTRAVESVLAQEGISTPQVILVDDASTDDTRKVIQGLADANPNIEAYKNHRNMGAGGARNHAISKAKGDWIAVLDADDAYEPTRLVRLIEVAESHELDVIADLPMMFDLVANLLSPKQLKTSPGEVSLLKFTDFFGCDKETGLDLGLIQPVFSRKLLLQNLLTYPENIRFAEDCALYISLTRSGSKFGLLREAHYIYSARIGAVSKTFSPGSVTKVDYLSIVRQTKDMRREFAENGKLDSEVDELLREREARALLANRRYGWNVLRMGEYRRFYMWLLQNPKNCLLLLRIIISKIAGHRGLPD